MEQITAVTLLRVTTAKGKTVHGFQYNTDRRNSNIICALCLNRGKLHTSKNLKAHTKHVLAGHPEIL